MIEYQFFLFFFFRSVRIINDRLMSLDETFDETSRISLRDMLKTTGFDMEQAERAATIIQVKKFHCLSLYSAPSLSRVVKKKKKKKILFHLLTSGSFPWSLY